MQQIQHNSRIIAAAACEEQSNDLHIVPASFYRESRERDGTYGKVVEKPGYRKADTSYSSKALFQVLMMAGLSAFTKQTIHHAACWTQNSELRTEQLRQRWSRPTTAPMSHGLKVRIQHRCRPLCDHQTDQT